MIYPSPLNDHCPITFTHTNLTRSNRSTSWSTRIATVKTWTAKNCNAPWTFTTKLKTKTKGTNRHCWFRWGWKLSAFTSGILFLLHPINKTSWHVLMTPFMLLGQKKKKKQKAPSQKKAKSCIDKALKIDGIAIDQVAGFYFFAEVRDAINFISLSSLIPICPLLNRGNQIL